MKKILSLLIGILLVINLIPLASPYVSDRRNITIYPFIDGATKLGLIPSRNNIGLTMYIGSESGLVGYNYRDYMSYNTTKILNNSRIESLYLNLTSVSLDAWDSLDEAEIKRLNQTKIDLTNPNASILSNLISSGDTYTTTNSWIANTQRRINIYTDNVREDIYNQTINEADGYFSLGIDYISSNDEFLYFNTTEGGLPPLLVMQTSCLPPLTSFFSTYEWIVNTTCVITDENITTFKNLTIQDSGNLILNGSTILNMSSSGAYIKIYSGGRLTLGGTAKYFMR